MDITTLFTTAAVLVPVTLGLVQIVKGLNLPSKFAPILSIVFGIGLAFLLFKVSGITTLAGIFVGLSAAGLWSGTKATFSPSTETQG